nr:hypothetical protein GCM10020185_21840 [Pseudomonas brassicacearum subsp. brassicacearum]
MKVCPVCSIKATLAGITANPFEPKPRRTKWITSSGKRCPASPSPIRQKPLRQTLGDLTGDGRLDWVVAQPGLNGFSLGADRSWSDFAAFHAFPAEFFSIHKGNWPT